jgi:hypothetical protein
MAEAGMEKGGGKRDSMMVPQEQLVFHNGFALDSMIQACSNADQPEKLLAAVKRLTQFLKSHNTATSEKQKDKITIMVTKQKEAKRKSKLTYLQPSFCDRGVCRLDSCCGGRICHLQGNKRDYSYGAHRSAGTNAGRN